VTAMTTTLAVEPTSAAGATTWLSGSRPILVGVLLAGLGTTATIPAPGEAQATDLYVLEHSTTAGASVFTQSSAGAEIGELRRLTGFTWDQLAHLFGLSRRSLHFWASGKPMASSNEEHLHRLLATVRKLDRGSASENRRLLLTASRFGEVPMDLLAAQQYERALEVVGEAASHSRPTPSPLSQAARDARRPRPPADRVDLLHDRVHFETGRTRAAKSVKVRGAV
jgi:DNA-binding transcriptional regulator YiaG